MPKRHCAQPPFQAVRRLAWSLVLKRFPPREPLVVPFDGGRSRIYADMRTAFGRQLYRYRDRDPDLVFVRSLLKPGDVFIDGGAHVGTMSMVAARAVGPDGIVHAFEPNPETFAGLRRNIELNRLANVILHEQALGDEEGEAEFSVMEGDRAPWSHLGGTVEEHGARAVTVRVTTLDNSIPRDLWNRIGLIKLDLEGAEYTALKGANALLDAVHPPILIEFVPEHFVRLGVHPSDILGFLRDLGYELLRPTRVGQSWRPCSDAEAMHPDPERPNLLVTASMERLRDRGICVCEAGRA